MLPFAINTQTTFKHNLKTIIDNSWLSERKCVELLNREPNSGPHAAELKMWCKSACWQVHKIYCTAFYLQAGALVGFRVPVPDASVDKLVFKLVSEDFLLTQQQAEKQQIKLGDSSSQSHLVWDWMLVVPFPTEDNSHMLNFVKGLQYKSWRANWGLLWSAGGNFFWASLETTLCG